MNFTRTRYQTGSMQKKNRADGGPVWEFRWYEPSDNSHRRTMIVGPLTLYPSESSARKAAEVQAVMFRINSSQPKAEAAVPTLGTVIARYQKEELPERYCTRATYLSLTRSHILPRWGEVLISQIKPLAVERWLSEMPTSIKTGASLSAKTRNHIKAHMHVLFEYARRWEWIETNPIDLVRVKGGSRRSKIPKVLTVDQFRAILADVPDPYRTMAIMAGCLGLRVSEISGLQWNDFNFKDSTILISRSVVQGRVGDVKTEYSHDHVPLDASVAAVLQDYKSRCYPTQEGWLFANPGTGRPYLSGQAQRKHIGPAAIRAGVGEGVGWHTFRHSYRSWLDKTDASMAVQQELMRHADIQTTMNVYGKAAEESKRKANSKVVEMIMPERRKALLGVNGSLTEIATAV